MGESDIQGEMLFIDTQTNKIYWQEYFDEIVDLVNEQQDTIDKLKEENERLKKARDESDKFIVEKGLEIEFLGWCMK